MKKFKGILKNGFKFEIDLDFVDDYEFFEMLAEAEENAMLIPLIIKKILGEEQKKKLILFLKEKEGKAKTSSMQLVIQEIFEKINEENEDVKN